MPAPALLGFSITNRNAGDALQDLNILAASTQMQKG